ncbi:phage holin family protein [Nocardioides sp. GY 10113]|uniref:phage holin family protein n=1 Tax=Nocardioides sp. GY 10113 TaxID=2569761 RepID=UPI0010A89CB9|nr:phage holin family protein [Nocardioides sp. GY 10113]TIC89074.1 phage holin family protein [Nocardioides sp. GY 10113]
MATDPIAEEPTIGRLIKDAQSDISILVRKEIELAKSELKVSVTAGGTGVALLGVAAFLLLLALIMFSVALAYFIHWNGEGLDLQWAFLCVVGIYVLLAALVGFIGVRRFKKVRAPERAINQGREIPKALKGQA